MGGLLLMFSCQPEQRIDYNTQVKPILNNKCISCHGGVKKQAGFSLLFEEEAFAKLKSGRRAIVPGQPAKSEMIRRIKLHDPEERMPYQEEALSKQEIRILSRWIKEGAEWGTHWTYQAVKAPKLPKKLQAKQPIDHFIQSHLQGKKLSPSEKASPHDLARRASLDLIGFPAPDTLRQTFLANPGNSNYAQLVDSLLASPHFGEKWSSMWLDMARYADTKGYERDPYRSIWRYRDWVVRAFNQDMPYDQFITEQLAGDLLDSPSEDQYLATAFHRNTMTNDEGGTDNEEFRTAAIIDRVHTTWESLLGTTFACAQCHSHPYDPFTQKEYYQFAAFFNNSRDEDSYADYPVLKHFDEQQIQQLQQIEQFVSDKISAAEKTELISFIKTGANARNSLSTDQFVNAELGDTKWLVMRNHASARLPKVQLDQKTNLRMRYNVYTPGGLLSLRLDDPKGDIIAQVRFSKTPGGWQQLEIPIQPTKGTHDIFFTYEHPTRPGDDLRNQRKYLRFDWFYFSSDFPGKGTAGYTQAKNQFEDLLFANVPTTPIMLDNPQELFRETHVFDRGNWRQKGEVVSPSTPASLNPFPENAPANRLGLAQWLCAPDHPLTARNIVNKVWEQLFGMGLVETIEDLGSQGAQASHQELLDYLSWQLIHEYDWSLKSLIREMMCSETYQQSSKVSPQHLEIDPENRYLARMSRTRLSGEQLRDQALAVSGALHPALYGPPVMPYQPQGIWSAPYDGSKWVQSEGKDRYRRAIYTYWKRTSPYPSMITFDAVGREICNARRIRTNTPLQALAMLNDSVYIDLAIHLAKQVFDMNSPIEKQLEEAYERVAGQKPVSEKIDVLKELYDQALKEYQTDQNKIKNIYPNYSEKEAPAFAALVLVANALFNLDEVVTRS